MPVDIVQSSVSSPSPPLIDSTAYSKEGRFLAVGHSSGSLHLYDGRSFAWKDSAVGVLKAGGARRLVWLEDRLFSAGLTGEVVEWALSPSLHPIRTFSSRGGAIFDFCQVSLPQKTSDSFLACADDAGRVTLLQVESKNGPCLENFKVLSSGGKKGPLVSITSLGDFLFCGSKVGSIERWNLKTFLCDSVFNVEASGKKESIVWALASSPSSELLVAGDSLGKVTFWDPLTCTLTQKISEHEGDVISLEMRNGLVVAGGVDGRTLLLTSSAAGSPSKSRKDEVYTVKSTFFSHTRDVTSISLRSDMMSMITGGLDGKVIHSELSESQRKKWRKNVGGCEVQRITPLPLFNPGEAEVSISSSSRTTLLRFKSAAELWYFPKKNSNSLSLDSDDKPASPSSPQVKLVEINPEDGVEYSSSALSSDGSLIALGSAKGGLKVFKFDIAEMQLFKVFSRGPEKVNPKKLVFFKKGGQPTLGVVDIEGRIRSFKIGNSSEESEEKPRELGQLTGSPTFFEIQKGSLVVGDSDGFFGIFPLRGEEGELQRVPVSDSQKGHFMTSCVLASNKKCFFATSNLQIVCYDLEEKKLSWRLCLRDNMGRKGVPIGHTILALSLQESAAQEGKRKSGEGGGPCPLLLTGVARSCMVSVDLQKCDELRNENKASKGGKGEKKKKKPADRFPFPLAFEQRLFSVVRKERNFEYFGVGQLNKNDWTDIAMGGEADPSPIFVASKSKKEVEEQLPPQFERKKFQRK